MARVRHSTPVSGEISAPTKAPPRLAHLQFGPGPARVRPVELPTHAGEQGVVGLPVLFMGRGFLKARISSAPKGSVGGRHSKYGEKC